MGVVNADNTIEQVLPDMPSRQEVMAELRRRWKPQPGVEEVPAAEAVGRVLARDACAAFDFPPAQTAGRDGIGVRFSAFANGIPDTSGWVRGQDYVTADMGDDVPDEFDTLIQVEDLAFRGADGKMRGGTPGGCSFDDGFEVTKAPEEPGGLNMPGSAYHVGDVIVPAGARVTPERAAAAVGAGIDVLAVYARPRIGIIPTGNELIPAGTRPQRGQTVESNSLLMESYARLLGGEPVMHGLVRDTHDEVAAAVDELLPACDVVLVNAGSSKGSEDCGPIVVAEHAEVVVAHGQRCAPGKPSMSAVTHDGKVLCVIPGPPMACATALRWLVSGLVAHWYGHEPIERLVRARVLEDVPAGGFEVWRRTTLEPGEDGTLKAHVMPMRSGRPAMGWADAILRTPSPAQGSLAAGDMADVVFLADGFSW